MRHQKQTLRRVFSAEGAVRCADSERCHGATELRVVNG